MGDIVILEIYLFLFFESHLLSSIWPFYGKVSDTVRKGIFDTEMYEGQEKTLMLGNLAALIGSAIWNVIATHLALPVSGTHSIVGAVLGFTIAARGKYLLFIIC